MPSRSAPRPVTTLARPITDADRDGVADPAALGQVHVPGLAVVARDLGVYGMAHQQPVQTLDHRLLVALGGRLEHLGQLVAQLDHVVEVASRDPAGGLGAARLGQQGAEPVEGLEIVPAIDEQDGQFGI